MADPARARKLAVRIRQIVSAAIEMQIKDPRLGMVTVTDAKVTGDLREATVFYTVYGDETQIAESAAALTSATGVLRSTVGKQTGIKFVPSSVNFGLVNRGSQTNSVITMYNVGTTTVSFSGPTGAVVAERAWTSV